MASNEIIKKIEELKELEGFIEELESEANAIRDSIKQEMLERNVEELAAGQYFVRWNTIISNRLDSTTFKKTLPDVYKSFLKQTTSRRFTID